MLFHGAGVHKGRDLAPETEPAPAVRRGLGSGEWCSQSICFMPLMQRLQFLHWKRLPSQYFRYWFFSQPHWVFRSTVQGESSTWFISGEGKRWSINLCNTHSHPCTLSQMHVLSCPHPAAQICIPSQVDRRAQPSHCPLDTSCLEPLPSPETHLFGTSSS